MDQDLRPLDRPLAALQDLRPLDRIAPRIKIYVPLIAPWSRFKIYVPLIDRRMDQDLRPLDLINRRMDQDLRPLDRVPLIARPRIAGYQTPALAQQYFLLVSHT